MHPNPIESYSSLDQVSHLSPSGNVDSGSGGATNTRVIVEPENSHSQDAKTLKLGETAVFLARRRLVWVAHSVRPQHFSFLNDLPPRCQWMIFPRLMNTRTARFLSFRRYDLFTPGGWSIKSNKVTHLRCATWSSWPVEHSSRGGVRCAKLG